MPSVYRKPVEQNWKPSTAEAKSRFLEYIAKGETNANAAAKVGRTVKAIEYWRREDKDFAAEMNFVRARRQGELEKKEVPDFPEFCREYLGFELHWHQLQWFDILEGREPREIHPSQTYVPGRPNRILINTPPLHAKALALDTEVLTANGWSTIGALRVGDRVFGPDGKPTTVTAKSSVFHKDCYRVVVNDGEEFVASGDHLWNVLDGRTEKIVTTRELAEIEAPRLPTHEALHMEHVDGLPLDPYLLGAWLGDGHTANGRFTTADPEIMQAFAEHFSIAEVPAVGKGAAKTYNALGLYRVLAELGVRGGKFIPEAYQCGSYDQRLALLQGLMDTDGTISAPGQASFTSTNFNLARGVLYLASSLGLRPSIREGRATLNGRDCGPKWTVWFAPHHVPVFRLARKLCRQTGLDGATFAPNMRFRKIVKVERVATVPTQCIVVDNDSHLFLIGRSLVPTHNSTTITQMYVTWCIVKNPNEHIVIVSQTKKLAKDFLYSIQQFLTHPTYRKMQQDFGPVEGWEKNAATWTKDAITFVPETAEGAKDPTVQAIGLGSQIYGSRATRIILDDVITLKNAKDHEAQIRWLAQEVLNRPGVKTGFVICVGTRVDAIDFYSELLSRFPGVYTYFAAPAVLEFADDPADWKVLWPENENTGPSALAMIKAETPPTSWARAYQQQTISDDATFPAEAVMACVNKARPKGALSERVRPGGMTGLTVIAGLDPATVGFTAAVVVAVDRRTKKRYVLDAYNRKDTSPAQMRAMIRDFTEKYGISEWRIERNAFQRFLTQDEELRLWLHSRGSLIREHYTHGNKWDPDFGVESMETLFADAEAGHGLIDFPNPNFAGCGVIGELIDQFITWTPKTGGKTDLLMACWFAEIKAREICLPLGSSANHKKRSFLTRRGAREQMVIDLEALAQEKFYQDNGE